MRLVKILNHLHTSGYYRFLSILCSIVYFVKGNGFVKVKYIQSFRAYECRIKGISYLTPGPGWAYSYGYLSSLLASTYSYYYHPKLGDTAVDIGAGLGEESIVLAQLIGPSGMVVAVEANPITHQALEYACIRNNFGWVKVINVALFKMDDEVTIEDDAESYVGNTVNTTGGKNTFKVRAITLDTLVETTNITRIDFLKLNIEGAEQFLLEGSQKSIQLVKNACISCHDFRHVYHQHGEFYVTHEKIKSFLISSGFEVITRNTGNVVVDDFVYAKRIST